MKSTGTRLRAAAAFSLAEVALALGIAAFCLVPLVALLPIGFNSDQAASSQTAAANILTHVLADLRATPTTSSNSAQYNIPIPAAGGSGTTTLYFGNSLQQASFATQAGSSRYRLTARFFPPASGRTATGVTLLVSWPAAVDPAAAPNAVAGRVQAYGALNRN